MHYGAAGVGTGNFNWIYAPNSTNTLMSLTYAGNLGIGITNPKTKLQVIGIASVSSLNVTGSVYVTGSGTTTTVDSLYVLQGQSGVFDSTGTSLFSQNLNITSGISTFYNLNVLTGIFTNIGIGKTDPSEALDVVGDANVSGDLNVGINTTAGVVLTSPNGTRYRLIVANNGDLSTQGL